jgi:hypothetical protein
VFGIGPNGHDIGLGHGFEYGGGEKKQKNIKNRKNYKKL